MRRLLGILLIVQAVLTYLILHAINRLSVFVTERALSMGEEEGLVLSWSGELPKFTYVVLAMVVILGIYFIVTKEKEK